MSPSDPAGPESPDRLPEETVPLLRIVKGDPTPQELAALVAVIAAVGSTEPVRPQISEWPNPRRRLRDSLMAGGGAWRASALPR